MSPKRRSIRDRNAAAIAHEIEQPEVERHELTVAEADTEVVGTGATVKESSTRKPQKRSTSDTRVDLGVYMTAEQFDAMRGAYLADFLNGGEANTLYLWVADALSAHARRSAENRIANSRIRDRAETGSRAETTKTKAFKIPENVIADMRAGIAEDRKAGRWATESAWAGEAISRAVEQAREKNGGTLPEPPARLPNRLKR
jgi:hypothetical protein